MSDTSQVTTFFDHLATRLGLNDADYALAQSKLDTLRAHANELKQSFVQRLSLAPGISPDFLRKLSSSFEHQLQLISKQRSLRDLLATRTREFDRDSGAPEPASHLGSLAVGSLVALDKILSTNPRPEELLAVSRLFFLELATAAVAHIQARDERLAHREAAARDLQQQLMRELAAPVIEVWDEILVLPLIGTVDTRRAQEITESLLQSVSARKSRVLIIDITGLPVMDTSTANHLFKAARAVEYLGATTIVTGVRPTIAEMVVALGIDTSNLYTRSRLSDGLALAFEITGRTVNEPEAQSLPFEATPTESY